VFFKQRAFSFVTWAALVGALLVLSGCNREEPSGLRRVAFVPVEYQGSAVEHRWLADALEAAMADQMRGVQGVMPLRASDAGTAAAQGATALLRGIVSGTPGGIRLHFYLEDLRTGRVQALGAASPEGSARPVPLSGVLAALRQTLQSAGLAGAPFSTQNAAAFEAFGKALRAPDANTSIALLERATAADPAFTNASLRLAVLWQRTGQPERALAETERLLAALPADRTLDRAYAALQLASLRNDAAGIEKALAAVVAASPADLEAANRLATVLQQRRRYAEAAKVLRDVALLDAQNAALWNQIAYAEAFSGQRQSALQALEQYRKLSPQDPNVDDTTGDVLYFFGAFADAAASYEKAHSRNPQWQGGYPLFKASWARMYAGDLAAADQKMDQYLELIRTANKPLAELRAAQWQFLRGRREEARSSLNAIFSQASLPRAYRSVVASQLYVWDIAEGKFAQLEGEFRSRAPRYGSDVVPALGALLQGTRSGQTPAQRAAAIQAVVGRGAPQALVAAATYLDARRNPPLSPEAMQALVVADQSIPEAQGMFTHALAAWGFLERGEAQEAALLFARRIPPVATDDGLLWPLIFPDLISWELEAWKQAGQQPPVPHMPRLWEQLRTPAAAAR
jgi:tetratricopeptide (TPR) repeat protein